MAKTEKINKQTQNMYLCIVTIVAIVAIVSLIFMASNSNNVKSSDKNLAGSAFATSQEEEKCDFKKCYDECIEEGLPPAQCLEDCWKYL